MGFAGDQGEISLAPSIANAELIFKYDFLREATSNFNLENKLGEGGFGSVFKVSSWSCIEFNFIFKCNGKHKLIWSLLMYREFYQTTERLQWNGCIFVQGREMLNFWMNQISLIVFSTGILWNCLVAPLKTPKGYWFTNTFPTVVSTGFYLVSTHSQSLHIDHKVFSLYI